MARNRKGRCVARQWVMRIGLCAGLWPTALLAEQARDTQGSDPQLADIIVTAQKRSENLQSVPIAITALNSGQLESQGLRNVQDIAAAVPGMIVSRDDAWGEIYIRGVGTNIISVGSDASVAEYIDGVYVARPNAALQEFSDLERVEVLKGPQGTLYGRNATGGAIAITTRKPSGQLEASANLIYGNYDLVRLRGSVSGPLSDGVRVRLSGIYSDQDGYQRNLFAPDRQQGGGETKGGRLAVDLGTSDVFSALVSFDYSKTNATLLGDKVSGAGSYAASKVAIPSDPFVVNINGCHCMALEQFGATATLTWKPGALTLKSISGYRDDKLDLSIDVDRSQIDFITLASPEHSKTFSQEFQVASPDHGAFTWLAGLYYFHENGLQNFNISLNNPLGDAPPPQGSLAGAATNITNSYAVFGQANYRFSDVLRLTLGGRYTWESKLFHKVETDNLIFPPFGIINSEQGPLTARFNAFTPKVGIEYTPSTDTLLYASVTKGFKSGGWNSIGQAQPSFSPETLWAYTTGAKLTMLDRRLRFNVEAYYYDYRNLQVNRNAGNGVSVVDNAASATIKGLDADIVALPITGLQLEAHLAYIDSQYDSFLTADPKNPQLGVIDLKGRRLPRAPRFAGSVALQYSHAITNRSELSGRIELVHQGKIYFDSFNDPELAQSSYELLNARLAYRFGDGRWEAAIFGNNLTDKHYWNSGSFGTAVGNTLSPGTPRVYGVQLSVNFH